jgi:hypothetical protein
MLPQPGIHQRLQPMRVDAEFGRNFRGDAGWPGEDDQAARFGTHDGDMVGALDAPIAALRILLAGKPARERGAPRKPREGTKQEQVLAMLRRPEGATVVEIADATAWNSNTVRGFFAGLKKKGHVVEVRDRIRQVGPNKTGAKGSFTVYFTEP